MRVTFTDPHEDLPGLVTFDIGEDPETISLWAADFLATVGDMAGVLADNTQEWAASGSYEALQECVLALVAMHEYAQPLREMSEILR